MARNLVVYWRNCPEDVVPWLGNKGWVEHRKDARRFESQAEVREWLDSPGRPHIPVGKARFIRLTARPAETVGQRVAREWWDLIRFGATIEDYLPDLANRIDQAVDNEVIAATAAEMAHHQ